MYFVWVGLLFIVMTLCWVITLLGFPGNWLILAAAWLFSWLVPHLPTQGIRTGVLVSLAGLALLGEILEFAAGAAGMAKGGSKRGALLAVVGSFLGAIFGAAVGIPIPVLGSLVGVIVFAGLGSMAGAIFGELWVGSTVHLSVEIGKAAFWGRLLGSIAKILVGSVMIAVATVAALV